MKSFLVFIRLRIINSEFVYATGWKTREIVEGTVAATLKDCSKSLLN